MLIVLNGPPQAGKTTMAKELIRLGAIEVVLNAPFKKFVLDNLQVYGDYNAAKDAASSFGSDYADQYVAPVPPARATVRDAMIAAADALELCDPAVWVRNAIAPILRLVEGNDVFVLDSIGKSAQWAWLRGCISNHHLVLVKVRRDPQLTLPGAVFSDGRCDINQDEFVRVPSAEYRVFNGGTIQELNDNTFAVYRIAQTSFRGQNAEVRETAGPGQGIRGLGRPHGV